MKSVSYSGLICVKNKLNIEFRVCRLDYIINEDETYKYVFTPYYDVISLLGSDVFQGIPGLNLDVKKEQYVRENMQPCFITERVPQPNRVDYWQLLADVGLTYYSPIEYLTRTDLQYSGDDFYMIEYEDRRTIKLDENITKQNSSGIIKMILDNIGAGNEIILSSGNKLNNSEVFEILSYIYEKNLKALKDSQEKGIEIAKENKTYLGRKPVYVNSYLYDKCAERVYNKEMTVKEAAQKLGISVDKYYRYKKSKNK